MSAYYNEFEPYAAQWLRNLISAGHIPAGDVDERSITEVSPDDLKPYNQSHFFAGIGGWPLALRMAGWDDTRPVWTGSCPCQPFSTAGKKQGKADERHLWPVWFRLIAEHRPPVIFGEQVAAAIAHEWLDEAFDDLEGKDYACAAAVLPACSVGAPHRRDRLWFVADSIGNGRSERRAHHREHDGGITPSDGQHGTLADANDAERRPDLAGGHEPHREDTGRSEANGDVAECGSQPLADTDSDHGHWWSGPLQVGWNCIAGQASAGSDAARTKWLTKPGLSLLAHGIPGRVGRLRAYGNAIVPHVAAEFIKAYGEIA